MLWIGLTWLLAAALAVLCAVWLVGLAQALRLRGALPRLEAGPGAGDEGPPPGLTVIVPMHNEERVADECLTRLRAMTHPAMRIVAALDRCTDGTAAIVRRHAASDARVRVLEITGEAGWSGKAWALHCAVQASESPWLLFLDADVSVKPALAGAMLRGAARAGLDMLCVMPRLRFRHWFEWLAQPGAVLMLLKHFKPGKEQGRPFGIGACMLVRRAAYDRAGLMGTVRDQMMEDVQMARRVVEVGGRVGAAAADGLCDCVMYESLAEFRAGWMRIFIGSTRGKVRRLRRYRGQALLASLATPGLCLLAMGWMLAGASLWLLVPTLATLGAALVALVYVYRLFGAPVWAVPGFFLGGLIVAQVLHRAASHVRDGRPIRWAGREFVVEAT